MAFLSTHPFALIPFDEEIGLAPSDVDHQAYFHSLLVSFSPMTACSMKMKIYCLFRFR